MVLYLATQLALGLGHVTQKVDMAFITVNYMLQKKGLQMKNLELISGQEGSGLEMN